MDGTALPVGIRVMRYTQLPTINFLYPVVTGLKDSVAEQRINYQIVQMMYRIIYELQQPGLVTYITGSFEIKANQRNVLSLALSGLGDFGGAHPVAIVHSLNFDTTTGMDYPLSAQFKGDSDYVQILSGLVSRQIEERDILLIGDFQGISPEQEYYIANNLLVLYFQRATISPDVEGFPYFPIPLYEIEDILAANGLLIRMTGVIQ
ncbi:MAG: DUF3298 and DUF4163 domain-containing protein [Clostridiales bacterium]|nr:DUF3298 and DUF4163 domain-containing protein [Clostridiales bacterium]